MALSKMSQKTTGNVYVEWRRPAYLTPPTFSVNKARGHDDNQ